MQAVQIEILEKFPELDIQKKEHRTFINRVINSGIDINNLKCINQECNNFKKWTTGYGFNSCCSNECKHKSKFLLDQLSAEKRKQTCLSKHGVEYISQLEESQIKIKETCLQNFGVENPSQSDDIQKFKRLNYLEQTGYTNPMFNPDVKQRIKETILNRQAQGFKFEDHYTKEHLLNIENWKNKEFWEKEFLVEKYFDLFKCTSYFNCVQSTAHKQIKKLEIEYLKNNISSREERNISAYIKSFNVSIESNTRSIIKPQELDIYIPDNNIAIEYNGIYWHSYMHQDYASNPKQTDIRYSKQRHKQKTDACQAEGIQLFHIFENEWLNPVKQEIWKSVLENALGKSKRLGARKCILKPVPTSEIKKFLGENHLQGYANSPIAYGLYYENELYSLMTFASGKGRMDKNTDWELIRFCNKKGYNVQGAASRLLKAFRADHPGSIKSYANRRWSNGNLYRALGFKELGISEPNHFYWHLKDSSLHLHARQSFQKHKQSNKLEIFDPNKTALDNMIINRYTILWDSGNYNFILE